MIVSKNDFIDWDGIFVPKGTELGELVYRAGSDKWNTILNGKVTSVTLDKSDLETKP